MALHAFEPGCQVFHRCSVTITLDEVEDAFRFDEALMSAATAFRNHVEMKEGNLLQQDLVPGFVSDAAGYTHHKLTHKSQIGIIEQK